MNKQNRYKVMFLDRNGVGLGTFHIVAASESQAVYEAKEKFDKPYARVISRVKNRENKFV